MEPPEDQPPDRCADVRAGGDIHRDLERHLVRLWNELRVQAELAREHLGVDPALLYVPVLSDPSLRA